MHNISIYDTGKQGGYGSRFGRRNDNWTFVSTLFGGIMFMSGLVMILAGFFDPGVPTLGGVLSGCLLAIVPVINLALFVTHHNFMLDLAGTRAMDAVYRLPKDVRDQHGITRREANRLSLAEADDLVSEVNKYLSYTRGGNNGLLTLTASLSDFNNTAKIVESRS